MNEPMVRVLSVKCDKCGMDGPKQGVLNVEELRLYTTTTKHGRALFYPVEGFIDPDHPDAALVEFNCGGRPLVATEPYIPENDDRHEHEETEPIEKW